ncbi:MAG: RNA methyltransferase [Cytophagales bacterium]|nr:RNA methyltransferase [Cytophagales bacterium]
MRRKFVKTDGQYFGIGIYKPKTIENVGTLWRSALILGADFIFMIEKRYKKQASDIYKTWTHIPLYHYDSFEHFYESMPYNCQLIGLELGKGSQKIETFEHPARAIYLLGSEDGGLPEFAQKKCHDLIQLPGEQSLNVATAGSLVMYDRHLKRENY